MTLDVFLGSRKAGSLFSTADRGIVFAYSPEYISCGGAVPLSASLPLSQKEYTQKECIPFFEGLLPEDVVRRRVADLLHVSESSTLKLLEALGGECAGLVTISSEEYPANQLDVYEFPDGNYEPLSNEALDELIRSIPQRPFIKSSDKLRLSLAGAQEKLPIAYFDGRWYLPQNGAPSTHIIKPSRTDFPDIAENEYLCMKLAKLAGLNAPDVALFYSEGKSVFVVRRYDRALAGNSIRRVHQEDMCQALGIPSDRKYQADGGPSLKDISALIKRISSAPLVDMKKLLEYIAFNYLIGNCDSHGKNFSILYEDGKVSLAPLYDAVSTIVYPALTSKLSMKIGSRYEMERITRSDFVTQAEAMGIKGGMMLGILDGMRERLADAFKLLHDDNVWKKNRTLAGRIEEHCKLLA